MSDDDRLSKARSSSVANAIVLVLSRTVRRMRTTFASVVCHEWPVAVHTAVFVRCPSEPCPLVDEACVERGQYRRTTRDRRMPGRGTERTLEVVDARERRASTVGRASLVERRPGRQPLSGSDGAEGCDGSHRCITGVLPVFSRGRPRKKTCRTSAACFRHAVTNASVNGGEAVRGFHSRRDREHHPCFGERRFFLFSFRSLLSDRRPSFSSSWPSTRAARSTDTFVIRLETRELRPRTARELTRTG